MEYMIIIVYLKTIWLLKVIPNYVYLVYSIVGLTLSTTFSFFLFSPLFEVSASNMQCAPINNFGYDTVFSGYENNYICIFLLL